MPFVLEAAVTENLLVAAEPSEARGRPGSPGVCSSAHRSAGAQDDDRTGRKQTWGGSKDWSRGKMGFRMNCPVEMVLTGVVRKLFSPTGAFIC